MYSFREITTELCFSVQLFVIRVAKMAARAKNRTSAAVRKTTTGRRANISVHRRIAKGFPTPQ